MQRNQKAAKTGGVMITRLKYGERNMFNSQKISDESLGE